MATGIRSEAISLHLNGNLYAVRPTCSGPIDATAKVILSPRSQNMAVLTAIVQTHYLPNNVSSIMKNNDKSLYAYGHCLREFITRVHAKIFGTGSQQHKINIMHCVYESSYLVYTRKYWVQEVSNTKKYHVLCLWEFVSRVRENIRYKTQNKYMALHLFAIDLTNISKYKQ